MDKLDIIYKNKLYQLDNFIWETHLNRTYLIHMFFDTESEFIEEYDFVDDNIIIFKYKHMQLKIKATMVRQLGYIASFKKDKICYLAIIEGEVYNENRQ